MPGKIKVKVLAGRNLPVMDRASETTDAFVEIKFGGVTHKTDVCRKSLNPHWNSTEWYRFEVDESELQDEPLQLRLMDHDTYSANDAIGKVVISLAPLLAREANNAKSITAPHGGAVMSGWIPVFDTMHGIRGELNVIVKVELFSDFNKYKTSSCGVQFFHCPMIPPGYRATSIHGFVEELVVNDDPEYQWIDKIRTPRASNEARQVAFIKLSNQVQRLVGLKAAELGANAVVGYQQDFDLEGEAGVVARAIGTAVSITPLPTPSHPISMPPCTQQQLKKYLDILATDNDNVTDLNQYYQTHHEELQKLITVLNPNASSLLDEQADDDDDKNVDMTRHSSITSYTDSVSLYQDDYVSQKSLKHITEDQTELNKLLNRKDESDSDSSGPLQKIKKLKTNFFTKRFAMRSRKSDKDTDQISIKSNSSDTSRISFVDITNEFNKLKRITKPKFRKTVTNKEEEGVGMASILARSVIHAHTSLACIAETQDSEQSPSSTLRRTSESEPTINMSDDDETKNLTAEISTDVKNDIHTKVPEIRFTSLTNISTGETETITHRTRTISESCPTSPIVGRSDNSLKLPEDASYYGSISSALSGDSSEIYSSTDEDDESSDVRTDTERSIETTSSVVQTVLNHEVNPAIIAQMDKKLSILKSVIPEPNELKHQEFNEKFKPVESVPDILENEESDQINVATREASTSPMGLDTSVTMSSSNYIKIHNPFVHKKASKSISAPASPTEKDGFVYRSSKRIKKSLSKISKSSMIKSLSHYSLLPKKKQETKTLSRPGSATHVPSKSPSETVLGSHFLSYSDLQSLSKEGFETRKVLHKSDELDYSKISMYIGSEPVSRTSLSGLSFPHYKDEHNHQYKKEKSALKPSGLVHTAMETILIDKVQSLLIPTSPERASSHTTQFFNDVSEKLEQVEEFRINESHIAVQPRYKAQSMPPETPKSPVKTEPFLDDFRNKTRISEISKITSPTGLLHTAMETILMDKVQSLIGSTTAHTLKESSDYEYNNEKKEITKEPNKSKESTGLVHTAMKTILMDKAQCMLPEKPEPIAINTRPYFDDKHNDHNKYNVPKAKDKNPSGLICTAMETILLDKAQCMLAETPQPIPIKTKPCFSNKNKSEHNEPKPKDKKPTGLVYTAMETLLMDKAQCMLPEMPKIEHCFDNKDKTDLKESKHNDNLTTGLVHTAMTTILMDKIQNLCGPITPASVPERRKDFVTDEAKTKENEAFRIAHTAMETTDEVKDLLGPQKAEFIPKNIEGFCNETYSKRSGEEYGDVKSAGFADTSMETMFIDDDNKVDEVGNIRKNEKSTGLVQTAKDVQSSISTGNISGAAKETKYDTIENKKQNSPRIVGTVAKNLPMDVQSTVTIKSKDSKSKNKKLIRQDSVHSVTESESQKMSEKFVDVPRKVTKPVLQHFHPMLGGGLETIPSLPESSLEHTESLDVEGVDTNSGTNDVSVCDNSHAVCDVGRSERDRDKCEKERGSPRHARHESYGGREPVVASHAQNSSLNAPSTPMGIHRRSSDSDLSVTPKGGSLNASAVNVGSGGGAILRPSMNSNNLDMLEYPFLTMTEYPPGFIVHIGGTVCARSVKLVDGGGESAARAAWWAELRTELRAHARALRCNAVIAYSDTTAICEDVCVLSASGTAAVINLDCGFNADPEVPTVSNGSKSAIEESESELCSVAHVPYSPGAGPYRAELCACAGCRRARVPAVLLATCAKPNRLTSYAKAVTLTAVAARVRRAQPTAEPGARDISDQLPFLEYELHKLLLAKLRMQGANALFSLQTQIAIGERCVMALASGTAFRLAALPPPTPPRIKASEHDKDALEIQKALWDSFNANKAANGYDIVGASDHNTNGILPEVEGEDPPVLDLCADKDACVLELDEAEDVETARALATRRAHLQVYTPALQPQSALVAPPLAFAQVWRARLALGGGQGGGQGGAASPAAERHVARALGGVAYKLRRLHPCALVAPRFQLELPEDEIQLIVSGAAIPLQDPTKPEHSTENGDSHTGSHGNGSGDADDDIFALDEEQLVKSSQQSDVVDEKNCANGQVPTTVCLSTLSQASGGRAARRLCALRLLFVRETTTVRELGGLSGFLHTFTCEVLAIARAYTAALGGNALTSFYITQLMLQDNAHKNQGQCLLSVGGDVVHITY